MSEINPLNNILDLYNLLKILPDDIIGIIIEYNQFPWRIVPKWNEQTNITIKYLLSQV